MKRYRNEPHFCKAVQKRIALHFEMPSDQRRYDVLRDPLFIEGLLEHIVDFDERRKPYLACSACWQRYHDLLAAVREA